MAKKKLAIDMSDERLNPALQFITREDEKKVKEVQEEEKAAEVFDIGVPPLKEYPKEPIEDILSRIDQMNRTGELTGEPTGISCDYSERLLIKEKHRNGKKTKRMVLMVSPSLYNEIAWSAKETGQSMNELIIDAILEQLY